MYMCIYVQMFLYMEASINLKIAFKNATIKQDRNNGVKNEGK